MNPHGSAPRILINGGARVIPADPGLPVLFTLMRQGIFIPSACGGRASCGQCRVRVPSGGPAHVPEEKALLSESDRGKGVHLSCQLRVTEDLRIELPEGYLHARQLQGPVTAIRDPARGLREVDIAVNDPYGMAFTAGQYVQFLLPGTEREARPTYRAYSIASPPSRPGLITLLFARVTDGACTSYVFDRLRSGDTVTVNGPFGEFRLRDGDRSILFIAGGSGIAPIRAMLMDMEERRITRETTFFFVARQTQDLLWREEMESRARRVAGFRFIPVLSHPAPDDAWTGERGGMASVLARLLPRLDHHEAYLCGGPGMIDTSIAALRSRGLADELVFFDKFS